MARHCAVPYMRVSFPASSGRTSPVVGRIRVNMPAASNNQISVFLVPDFLKWASASRVVHWVSGPFGSTKAKVVPQRHFGDGPGAVARGAFGDGLPDGPS